jgi:hypothetical protein
MKSAEQANDNAVVPFDRRRFAAQLGATKSQDRQLVWLSIMNGLAAFRITSLPAFFLF